MLARRTESKLEVLSGQGVRVVGMSILHSAVLSLGLIFLSPTVAGMSDFSRARVVLITLDIPLAASEWPTFVLTYCDDETLSREKEHGGRETVD